MKKGGKRCTPYKRISLASAMLSSAWILRGENSRTEVTPVLSDSILIATHVSYFPTNLILLFFLRHERRSEPALSPEFNRTA